MRALALEALCVVGPPDHRHCEACPVLSRAVWAGCRAQGAGLGRRAATPGSKWAQWTRPGHAVRCAAVCLPVTEAESQLRPAVLMCAERETTCNFSKLIPIDTNFKELSRANNAVFFLLICDIVELVRIKEN